MAVVLQSGRLAGESLSSGGLDYSEHMLIIEMARPVVQGDAPRGGSPVGAGAGAPRPKRKRKRTM
jgi:hypothetical protein